MTDVLPLVSSVVGRAMEAPLDGLLDRQRRRESSARSYPRKLPIALASGEGVEVRDTAGRTYIDCLAGAGALALGHHHPVVVEALQRTLAARVPLTTLDLTTPVKDAFVEELFAHVPAGLRDGRIQFCGPTGADAVEAAVKLTRIATGRAPVVAFGGAYHGMTQGTLALTGSRATKTALGGTLPAVHHLPFPTSYRWPFGDTSERGSDACARLLSWLVNDDHSGVPLPAAVVLEPVQGEGGVHPAPESFGRAVREITRKASVPLVVDEVQTGVGRTGALWACEEIGLDPDVLVLSKAIGGGLPLAVIVYRAELDVWPPGAHAGTFRGNQLAMAAGAATLRHVVSEGLAERAAVLGKRLIEGLRNAGADEDVVGDVRGRGLMVGVEMVDPASLDEDGLPRPDGRRAAAMQRAMLDLGVIIEVGGRADAVVRFLPPLVLEDEHVDRIVAAFAAALRRISGTLAAYA